MSSDRATEMGEIWIDRKIRQDPFGVVSASVCRIWLGVSEERLQYTSDSLVGNPCFDGIESVMNV